MDSETFDGRQGARVAAIVGYIAVGIVPAIALAFVGRFWVLVWLLVTLPWLGVCILLATNYALTLGPAALELNVATRRTRLPWAAVDRVVLADFGGRPSPGVQPGGSAQLLVYPNESPKRRRMLGPRPDPATGALVFWTVRDTDWARVDALLRQHAGDRYRPA